MTVVSVKFNKSGTNRYYQYSNAGLEWFARLIFVNTITEGMLKNDCRILLENQFPKKLNISTEGKNDNVNFEIIIESRWLGEDTGNDILVEVGNYFEIVQKTVNKETRKPTEIEKHIINKIIKTPIKP